MGEKQEHHSKAANFSWQKTKLAQEQHAKKRRKSPHIAREQKGRLKPPAWKIHYGSGSAAVAVEL